MPHVRGELDVSRGEKRTQPGLVARAVSAFIGSLAPGVLAEALRNAWQQVSQMTPGVQHRASPIPIRSARATCSLEAVFLAAITHHLRDRKSVV